MCLPFLKTNTEKNSYGRDIKVLLYVVITLSRAFAIFVADEMGTSEIHFVLNLRYCSKAS